MTPEEIAALTDLCHPDNPWTPDQVRLQCALPTTKLLTRQRAAVLMATLIAPEAEIIVLDVHPDLRRQGLARDMLLELKCMAAIIHLEVAADNTGARALYESQGFTVTGRRQGYYFRMDGPRVDALNMTWRAGSRQVDVSQESVDPPDSSRP